MSSIIGKNLKGRRRVEVGAPQKTLKIKEIKQHETRHSRTPKRGKEHII
jgi:hypothetical protein